MSKEIGAIKIKQCLNCRIMHKVISELYSSELELDTFDMQLSIRKGHPSIARISSALKLECKLDDAYTEIIRLLNTKPNYTDRLAQTATSRCLARAYLIIPYIAGMFRVDPFLRSSFIIRYDRQKILILELLNEIVKNEYKHLNKRPGSDATRYYNAAKETINSVTQARKNKDELGNEDYSAKVLRHILKTYCYPSNTLNFKYPNRSCEAELFLEFVQQSDNEQKRYKYKPHTEEILKRAISLSSKDTALYFEYIRKAPKKIGWVIKLIMDMQGLGYSDMADMLGSGLRPRSIESICNSAEPNRSPEFISSMCQILLVDNDTAVIGEGIRYGNWNDLYNNSNIKIIQDAWEIKSKIETKEKIREEFVLILNNYQYDFDKLCELYPDLFSKEMCSVFDDDYGKMYEYLLHPEDADTLLDVLEYSMKKDLDD